MSMTESVLKETGWDRNIYFKEQKKNSSVVESSLFKLLVSVFVCVLKKDAASLCEMISPFMQPLQSCTCAL